MFPFSDEDLIPAVTTLIEAKIAPRSELLFESSEIATIKIAELILLLHSTFFYS